MIGWDGPNGAAQRDRCRERHVEHIRALERDGHVRYAGPIRNEADDRSIGAVIVVEAADLRQARAMIDSDPYVTGGVFESLTVSPFKQVIPEPR
jgi:uncharacterized protein YciI